MLRKLILFVEDTPDDEALLLRALGKSGIDADVAIARDGEEALEFLFATGRHVSRDAGHLPDIVFSDLKLDKMDGVELLERIRADARTRVVPVVILSSSAQDDDRRRAYFHGANGYIRRPEMADAFLEVVRQLGSYWLVLNEAPPSLGKDTNPEGQLVGFGKVTRDSTERREATEQFRLAIEAAPTGMLMMDRAGKIVLVNVQVEKLFGYPRAELLGQRIEILVPERFRARHPDFRRTFFGDPKARAMGGGRELYGLRKDGTEVPIEIGLNPLQTSEGDFVLSSVVDITERKGAERERENLLGQLRTLNAELEERVRDRTSELSATLEEREVLLQEIHHRVKNNLQVISSLINMQVRQLEDKSSRSALEECQTRIQAIALIHEKLYQSKDYSRVPFSDYAKSLAGNVFSAAGVEPAAIVLDLHMEDLSLAVDKAIPCGLILNELITNALKHAFPDARRGTVRVELRRAGDREIVLAVGDDGIGIAAGFDPAKSNSLGVQLVMTLVEQLDGKLEILRNEGTTIRVTFPLEGPA